MDPMKVNLCLPVLIFLAITASACSGPSSVTPSLVEETVTFTLVPTSTLSFSPIPGDTDTDGLPLLGFADWNDTINLAAGAELLLSPTSMVRLCWR